MPSYTQTEKRVPELYGRDGSPGIVSAEDKRFIGKEMFDPALVKASRQYMPDFSHDPWASLGNPKSIVARKGR